MVLVVLCTFPDEAAAAGVVRTLVEEKLIACGSIVPGVRSIYAWEGRLEDTAEVLVVCKTASAVYARLEKRLRKLHPYDTPEILAFEAGAAAQAYAAWVADSVE
jgi:periplasmic divalent cation tolerance protein